MPRIRSYETRDRSDVYSVCVRTGDSGADATGAFGSDDLLPDVFVGPYLHQEPELAWVVDAGGRVAGYLVATADFSTFLERYRAEWLPWFAARYPLSAAAPGAEQLSPEQRLVAWAHDPPAPDLDVSRHFPAQLHIDLLPELQGKGYGRMLIRILLAELRERGIGGVHLGVDGRNTGARAFYSRLGFLPLGTDPHGGEIFGIRTDASV